MNLAFRASDSDTELVVRNKRLVNNGSTSSAQTGDSGKENRPTPAPRVLTGEQTDQQEDFALTISSEDTKSEDSQQFKEAEDGLTA